MNEEKELPEVRIVVRPNGPYRVFGGVRLFDDDGNEWELPEGHWYTLCRCGFSENKPFCDSSHKRRGFTPETRVRPRAEGSQ
jgi:CDGSH-type Zn-finger protein